MIIIDHHKYFNLRSLFKFSITDGSSCQRARSHFVKKTGPVGTASTPPLNRL